MRYREDKPGDPERARAAVATWRGENPEGTPEQLVDAIGGQFHRDYGPVLRGALFAVDQDRGVNGSNDIMAETDRSGADPPPGHDAPETT